jgi:hypothetical protein
MHKQSTSRDGAHPSNKSRRAKSLNIANIIKVTTNMDEASRGIKHKETAAEEK